MLVERQAQTVRRDEAGVVLPRWARRPAKHARQRRSPVQYVRQRTGTPEHHPEDNVWCSARRAASSLAAET